MNICEAIESGKRYNRAIRQSHWNKDVYLYSKDGMLYLASPKSDSAGKPFEFSLECLEGYDWALSHDAPYCGPDGMITLERAREMAAQCWCQPETKHKVMDTDLAEAFAHMLMTLGNGTVAFIQKEKLDAEGKNQGSA
jgi:hypothetical protein